MEKMKSNLHHVIGCYPLILCSLGTLIYSDYTVSLLMYLTCSRICFLFFITVFLTGTLDIRVFGAQTGNSTINVGEGPSGVAYNPGNNNVYVTNRFNGSILVIDSSNEVKDSLVVGNSPQGVAFLTPATATHM